MLESEKQSDEVKVGRSCDKRGSTIETKEDREPTVTQVQLESNFETFKDDSVTTLKKDEISTDGATKNPMAKKNNRKRKCNEIVTNERRQTRQSTGILIPNRYQYETTSRAKKARTNVKFQSNSEESKLVHKFQADTEECAKENNYGNVIYGQQMRSLETSNEHDTIKHGLPMTRSKNNQTSKIPIISNVRSSHGDLKVSKSTESNVSSIASNDVSQTREQYLAENNTQLVGTKKSRSKHIPIQAMPLYNKGRVTQVKCESNNSAKSENALEKTIRIYATDVERRENIVKDEEISRNGIVYNKTKNYDYYSETSNLTIDSEKTWSNIGSMPGTPTHHVWSDVRPKESSNYEDVENTSFRVFSAIDTNCKKPNSNDIFDVRRAEDDKNNNLKIQVSSTDGTDLNVKHSRTLDIDIGTSIHESSRAMNGYSQSVKDVSMGCTEHQITDPGLRASEGSEEEPWSRHYQRPRSESTPKTKKSPMTRENKKASGVVGKKTASKNSRRATSSSRKQKEQRAKPTNEDNIKRGRPRKWDFPYFDRSTDDKDTRLTKKVRSYKKKCEKNGSATLGKESFEPSKDTRGGHAITTAELHSLWQKFCQHGHFRVDPNFRPFNAETTDTHRNLSTRMYCYDPPHYMCTQNQYQNPNGNNQHNDASRSNLANSYQSTNPPKSFSNDLIDLTTHSRYNSNNATMDARPSPNTENTTFNRPRPNPLPSFNYNSMIQQNPNSFSSYAQSSNGATSNHDQSYYKNNGNIHGNDNRPSGTNVTNATNLPNNHNAHMGMGRRSSGPNCVNNSIFIHDNGQPSVSNMDYYNKRNLSANNSVNIMQNTVPNNPNFNWGPPRSNLNIENVSVNQLNTAFLNGNSTNSAHMSGLSMNNESSVTDAHILMNSFMNTDFPTFPLPWCPGSSVYNPYVNNTPPYINNMHNAYNTFATFDHASFQFTNLAVRNTTNNSLNPWISNILPARNENSTINAANSEMSLLCSISSHGTVGPTTLDTTRDPDTSLQNLDTTPPQDIMSVESTLNVTNDNVSMTYLTPHRTSSVIQDTGTGSNYCSQESIDSYAQQSSVSHLVPFEPSSRTNDICNQTTSDITNDINNFLVVQDSINEKMKSREQQQNTLNYMPRRDSSPNREHANNKESEFSRLRQELVDFTRQYADDSTRSMTRMFNADEIYSYVMGQEQDIERKSP